MIQSAEIPLNKQCFLGLPVHNYSPFFLLDLYFGEMSNLLRIDVMNDY